MPTAATQLLAATGLFLIAALLEIGGCYLVWLCLREGRSPWLLVLALPVLLAFAYTLTLQGDAAGRTYAAYGGAYIAVALVWLWAIEGIAPSRFDVLGASVALLGMAIIALQPR